MLFVRHRALWCVFLVKPIDILAKRQYNTYMNTLNIIKWLATLLLIVGFGLVSAGLYEAIYIQMAGGLLWLTASVIMRDTPLIVTNSVMTLAGVLGLLYKHLV